MLVLSRRQGERIVIGDNVEVVVVEVRGDRVKLGFRAPRDVTIHREEIQQRIRGERSDSKENTGRPEHPISVAVA